MVEKDIAIVFDCGATNVRVVAIDKLGKIVASQAFPNETDEDTNFSGGRIWDLEKLWDKLCRASKTVIKKVDNERIAGVTVTTFGVDGTFTDKNGKLLYPTISWQCERTKPILENIEKYLSIKELYSISGVYPYVFNTINKLIWFKENREDIIEKADHFIFISSLLIHKLTGVLKNDATMMGTTMMADLAERNFSSKILNSIGLEKGLFGSIAEPGEKAGVVNSSANKATDIPIGTPVFFTGHDTQFAIFGSGAELNQPVLSSGTWEILMTRSDSFSATKNELEKNLTTEADAISGIFNIGQNWLGSGVLEWFSKHFYHDLKGDALYETMINDAEKVEPGSNGIMVDPAFINDGSSSDGGKILGLKIDSDRAQLYRAFLESMAFRLREGVEAIEDAGNFRANKIICVGGGSKNRLWNQLRADICNIPIELIDQKETTVLGASMFVFAGSGLYKSVNEISKTIDYNPQLICPTNNSKLYDALYQKFRSLKNENF